MTGEGARQTSGRSHRLLRQNDFRRVFSGGRRGFSGGLTVFVCAGTASCSRLGFAVSRKFGNAVARNRARRLLREAFRRTRDSWSEPLDVVARPEPGRFPDGLAAVTEALRSAVQKASRRPQGAARKPR